MNFLIDTNIIIPLEPCEIADLHVNIDKALEFYSLIQKSKNLTFIHTSINYDLNRDNNLNRAELRRSLLGRYQELKAPPSNIEIEKVIGVSELHSNNWVDNNLLSAVYANAVDCLVTEDKGIHKKAKRLSISDRVYYLEDAVQFLNKLFDIEPLSPPHVEDILLHQIDVNDQLFNSLRDDYPKFNDWFAKGQREQRSAYIIKDENNELGGICIKKEEEFLPNNIKGKVLKLCTFKISEEHSGNRYGELLLKSVFNFVKENDFEYAYFTVYPKQEFLINFAQDFGFDKIENNEEQEELILIKSFKYSKEDYNKLSAFEFYKKFGPFNYSFNNNNSFVVPIQPQWHKILFPDYEEWLLAPNLSCGNGIKKAYLSNSSTKKLNKGDNIFFYRSADLKEVTTVGIVEGFFRSKDPNKIAIYVGKRTVYSYEKIEDLCKKKNPVLAIKFRFVSFLDENISSEKLLQEKILKKMPESITQIKTENIKCLLEKIKL